MPPVFFELIEERIYNCLRKSNTNFRKPPLGLETGRDTCPQETPTLHYSTTGGLAELPFAHLSSWCAKPSLKNSRMNICAALLILKGRENWRRNSETDRMSHIGVLEGNLV